MRFLFLFLGLGLSLLSSIGFAQRGSPEPAGSAKTAQTNPTPPRLQKADPIARLRLSEDIPTEIENYRYLTSTKYAAEEAANASVAAFGFDRSGKRYKLGTVALGTEIKLDVFARRGVTLYYRLPFATIEPTVAVQGIPPQWAWISGRNIEVVAK